MLLALLLVAAPPSIAVLDVRTGPGVDPALGPFLAQVLASEVQARTGAAPLVSADITAMLGFERNKRMLGCSDDESSECVAEIAGALGVAEVLASSVALASGRYLVSASLLDSRHARPLKRATESAAVDPDALAQAMRRAAWQIFGGPEPVAPQLQGPSRRTWAMAAGGAALVLAGAGAVVGANALSQAQAGSGTARPRAHLADILFGAALLTAGAGAYLWFGASPSGAAVGGRW